MQYKAEQITVNQHALFTAFPAKSVIRAFDSPVGSYVPSMMHWRFNFSIP
jgi:hypothetical protein